MTEDYICTCPHCHSTLQFTVKDTQKESDNSTNYHIVCPVRCLVCGHFINDSYFKEKEITR